jgi:hypothetical protein
VPTDAPAREAVVPATADPSPAPTAPIPLFRRAGEPLADPHVLVAGRWVHLGTGRVVPAAPDDCARQRVHVLGSGRIVCVTADVTRSPGSRLTLFDLEVATVGYVRSSPATPPSSGTPAGDAERQALATLLGERDVVIGDPVAISVAPGPGPDDLVLAWAAVNAGAFEIGLEAFRLGGAGEQAERIGEWTLGSAPSTGRDAVETLGDLAVTVDAADGGTALVGWTEAGRGVAGPVRRLVAVPIDGSARPTRVAAAATRNLAPEAADGPLRTGMPCGGPFGEGFGGAGTAYVVCPGATAEIRVVDVARRAGGSAGAVVATARLERAGTTAGSAWLAGNGTVMDASRSILYRWSPTAGTIWRIELGGGTGRPPRVSALPLVPRDAGDEADSAEGAVADPVRRPILALDAARGRLYALDAPLPRSGGAVVHVIDVAAWQHVASYPVADTATRAISLSPDGALLYASTEPRQAGSPPLAVGVTVLETLTGIERAYAGRLRVGAGGPSQAVVVR